MKTLPAVLLILASLGACAESPTRVVGPDASVASMNSGGGFGSGTRTESPTDTVFNGGTTGFDGTNEGEPEDLEERNGGGFGSGS